MAKRKFMDRVLRTAGLQRVRLEAGPVPGYRAYRDAYGEAYPRNIYGDFHTALGRRGSALTLNFGTAFRCAKIIADEAAAHPLQGVHRKTGEVVEPGRNSAPERVAALISRGMDNERPNNALINAICIDLFSYGESFLLIHGISYLEPSQFELMNPTGANVWRNENGELVYSLLSDRRRDTRLWPRNQIVHPVLNHLLTDELGRVRGIGPLDAAIRSIIIGALSDEYVRREFSGDSLQAKYAMLAPGDLTEDQVKDIKIAFRKGTDTQGLVVFPNMGYEGEGGTTKLIALQNSDFGKTKGLREQRDYQVEDICRIAGVPLALMAVKGSQWGSGLLELTRQFLRFSGKPYMTDIQSAITFSCLRRTDYEVKFDLPALLAADGDLEAATKAWPLVGDGSQVLSKDEYRKMFLNMPPTGNPEDGKVKDAQSLIDQRKAAMDNTGGVNQPAPQEEPDAEEAPEEDPEDE